MPVRYASISSGFSSRFTTRISSCGAASASAAITGTVLDASPHQSSEITSSFQLPPAAAARSSAHPGTRAPFSTPSHRARLVATSSAMYASQVKPPSQKPR